METPVTTPTPTSQPSPEFNPADALSADKLLDSAGGIVQNLPPARIIRSIPGSDTALDAVNEQIAPVREQITTQIDEKTSGLRENIGNLYNQYVKPVIDGVSNIVTPVLNTVGGAIASVVSILPEPVQQFALDRVPLPGFIRTPIMNNVAERLRENNLPEAQTDTASVPNQPSTTVESPASEHEVTTIEAPAPTPVVEPEVAQNQVVQRG